MNGQWCRLLQPFECTDEKYSTALHVCVLSIVSLEIPPTDEKLSEVLQVLIEKMQDDILVRVDYEVNESGLTALEVLATFIDSYKQLYPEDDDPPSYPISTGLIQKAQLEVKAKVNDNQSSSYTAIISSAELANNKWDTIESLDSTMRTLISQHIDIFDWLSIKQTCKCLKSFPRPPPPPIDYHFIRFSFSNWWCAAYSGFAKTLPDVVDAFKFIVAQHQQDDIDTLEYEFIHLGDSEQPVIPLVRCPVTENVESFSFDKYLHPGGVKHFGLTVLGDPPRGSSRKKLLKIRTTAWLQRDGAKVDAKDKQYMYKNVTFDDSDMVAACIWFQDVKPSKDINFNHFWYTEELSNDFNDFGGSCYDIWLNPEMANPDCFYSNDRTSWVVSKFKTSMFSVS